jgi:hypothetical protein
MKQKINTTNAMTLNQTLALGLDLRIVPNEKS